MTRSKKQYIICAMKMTFDIADAIAREFKAGTVAGYCAKTRAAVTSCSKTFFDCLPAIVVLAFAGTGCTTYPYIEESLAQIESNPLSARFAPPSRELVEVPDLGSSELVGKWTVSFTEFDRVTDGQAVLPGYEFLKDLSRSVAASYSFDANGAYVRHEYVEPKQVQLSMHPMPLRLSAINCYYYGKWSYRDGVLTLSQERAEVESEGLLSPTRHSGSAFEVLNYKVEWLEGGEMILRDMDTFKTTDSGRVTVEVNESGVRTERTIRILGSEDGRERGEISERATLVRYKKAL